VEELMESKTEEATEGKTKEYLNGLRGILTFIETKQARPIETAARMLADVVRLDGIIYVFGTGHSHCAAEDLVYRAGGLAAIDLIYDPVSAGEFGMVKAGYMEQLVGVGHTTLRFSGISKKDALVVISNSGLNNEPIEAALYGRELGIPVIVITSVSYSSNHRTRHSGGKKLMDVADVVIDTGVRFPDATIDLEGLEQPMGPASTAISIIVGHVLCLSIASQLLQQGVRPDVYFSGNLDSAEEHNLGLWKKYRGSVRSL
jgi:uncharacterized phosphosugar-binding protein